MALLYHTDRFDVGNSKYSTSNTAFPVIVSSLFCNKLNRSFFGSIRDIRLERTVERRLFANAWPIDRKDLFYC